jgi:7,8-dihydropterin-6-yl-methyl-4-(beta-D-ribofuranosyl)aminobenzene 5'-phosphate synthase
MTGRSRVTVLVDDAASRKGLAAEHGFSLLLEIEGARVLFDTGQGPALIQNARLLGADLHNLDAVVISHGHYDHTGGLAEVVRLSPSATLYLHPAALDAKYARLATAPHRVIGAPAASLRALEAARDRLVLTRTATEAAPGVRVTGEIPRETDFEDVGGPFYRDDACSDPDPLVDDQALLIDGPRGTIVVLGCAHSGVVNTLRWAARLSGRDRIHALIGGMHLLHASADRLEQTGDAIERYGVSQIAPCHCTGSTAVAYLRERFGTRVVEYSAGSCFEFSRTPAN